MIGSRTLLASSGSAGHLCIRRDLYLFALLIFVSVPLRAASSDGFGPLFSNSSIEHSIGDKDDWSIQDGILTGKADSQRTESLFLLRQERFQNFILKFQARSDGAVLNVLFRAAILPPGQLAGFATTVGGDQSGSLTFRKPLARLPQAKNGEPGHAAPGFPDAVDMPFLRQAAEVELVRADSSKTGLNVQRGQWVDYEIDGLGTHILVKVNGTTTALFQVDDSFYEKVAGMRPPTEMMEQNGPFYEGMIGFQLPAESAGKVELKDIEIKIVGDVQWHDEGTAGTDSNSSRESWKASDPAFKRMTDAEWAQETHDLLEIAAKDEGFRPMFDGSTLRGWSNSADFWDVQDGVITGRPRNVFLVTDRQYSDFVLKGAVRLTPPGGNSGVQLRSRVIPGGMKGYQYDMGIPWWAQLYVESSMRGILSPVDDRMKRVNLVHTEGWNDFVIVCRGNHLIGELNGAVTFDIVDYYGDKTGLIGLQIHAGAPMTVGFKNLQIKELR
jgi:hypothetical protein